MPLIEIAKRLKEHLQHCIQTHGRITKYDKNYCIRYIMDFQPKFKKQEAESFYRDNVLYEKSIECEKLNITFDVYMDGEIIINAGDCGLLNVAKGKIKDFVKELQIVGGIQC